MKVEDLSVLKSKDKGESEERFKKKFEIDPEQKRRFEKHRESFLNPSLPYEPFIKTMNFTRSSGTRSKIPHFCDNNRLIHLMSYNERCAYLNVLHDHSVEEVYEQLALPIEDTSPICNELGINPPKGKNKGQLGYESFDFLFKLTPSDNRSTSWMAVAVKPTKELSQSRVKQRLELQRKYAKRNGIEFVVKDSDQLRVVKSETLELIYRNRTLRPFTETFYEDWLNTLRGELLYNADERMQIVLNNVATALGINSELSQGFFRHALWSKDIDMNWEVRLRMELSAKRLGVCVL